MWKYVWRQKWQRTPFTELKESIEPVALIHSNLCVLKFVQTKGGYKYFVTFLDDCAKYSEFLIAIYSLNCRTGIPLKWNEFIL